MSVRTINELFYSVVERNLDRVMLFKRKLSWHGISSAELYRNVVGVAKALEGWGIGKCDRVAILSENRPEWAIADFAAMALGAAVVPIYPTLTPEQMLHMLQDSGARVIFISTHDQLRKVLAIREHTLLEQVVLMDHVGTAGIVPMQHVMQNGPAQRDREFDRRAQAVGPDDLATVIYTSGTTGTPKGAMLTQGNLASNLMHSVDLYEFRPGKISLSFLPLSHITARHADYVMLWHGVTVAYCPFIDELAAALQEVKPQYFVGVPRVYEKFVAQAQAKAGSGMKRKIYDWAMAVGRRHKDEVLAGKTPEALDWKVADRLVFTKIKQALGGQSEGFISGSAPLNHDIIDWFAGIGFRIFEGYGLTETSPVIAINNPKNYRAGSVGKAAPNVQVRIADDGEILVKGPSVFGGYWNLPEETERSFDDGWFRTGDIGRLDEDGFLYITDRKKDLIKTSGGKFIAPQPIEARLKRHSLVAEAALVGERRKFVSVIIAPQFPALEDWAKTTGVRFQTREELVAQDGVAELYRGVVNEINENLAQFEKIKKVLVVPEEFSIANGILTPTLKVRRRVLEERYRTQLDQLYSTGPEVAATTAAGERAAG
jgi:long-chain acyl-CoA synthetase